MAEAKRFVVLGLGSFGMALATKLSQNGCRVTGVDSSMDRVDEVRNVLYEAICGNVTDRDTLSELMLPSAQAVFISLGEKIELSLLATLHCKELGAKRILVKGVTREHGRILEKLGVERVVFPEEEIAVTLADRMTWPNVLDFVQVGPEYSFAEMTVPNSLVGKSLKDADLRRKYNLQVVGVKDVLTGNLHVIPDGDFRLLDDRLLLVLARRDDLARFRELE